MKNYHLPASLEDRMEPVALRGYWHQSKVSEQPILDVHIHYIAPRELMMVAHSHKGGHRVHDHDAEISGIRIVRSDSEIGEEGE